MELTYLCTGLFDCPKTTWTARLRLLKRTNPYEMEVQAQGSGLHIIFGYHSYGGFLCIPHWGTSCELADFQDSFWNLEQLMGILSATDACSVADALVEVTPYLLE